MCTLVAFAHVFADHPLVVVANRDEQLDRASSGPNLWPAGFLAPHDDVAGGTWLGVGASGVFVGITNRFLSAKDEARESRGAVVARALEEGSAREIHAHMAEVSPSKHNGFHLFYADDQDAFATVSDGTHLAQLVLGKGVHVITERSFGAADDGPRRRRILAALDRLAPLGSGSGSGSGSGGDAGAAAASRRLDLDALSRLLSEHDESDPLASSCMHLTSLNYGTRSAMALAIANDRPRSRMLWAEGPPCTTLFAPVDVAGVLTRAPRRSTGVPGPVETR